MTIRILSIVVGVVIVGTCLTRAQESVGAFTLHIFRAEARFVEFVRTPVGMTTSMPPMTLYKKTGCRFQLNVDVISDDSSFLQTDSAFLVIGRLPDGQQFRQAIRNLQMVESSSSVFSATFEIQTTKAGWADIILAPMNSLEFNDLYDYPIKSDKRSVELDCRF